MLNLSLIRIDGGTQIRAELNQDTVSAYADAYLAGVVFPPIVVFFDGKDHWLADGFHRFFAAKKAGLTEILESITTGTKRDAILFSLGANGTHGLNRTNADKRNAVAIMLVDSEWVQWSDRKIAEACGVSVPFVGAIRRPEVAEKQKQNRAKTLAPDVATCNPITPMPPEVLVAPIDAPKPAPPTEPDSDEPPKYTPLDAANEQISDLQADLALARMGDVSSAEKQQAAELIADLRAEIKTLSATLKSTQYSRDSLMEECAQMKRQMAMQRNEIAKLKTPK